MFDNGSYRDRTFQYPDGICDQCYVLWKELSSDQYTGSIFCASNQTCAFLHDSGEWVVLHSVSVDEFVREWSNYYRDLRSAVMTRLNELLTLDGTTAFLAQETGMEQSRVARICESGKPWPLPRSLAPLWKVCAMFTTEQVAYLRQLSQDVPAVLAPPAKEHRFLEHSHPREKESAYFARLAPLLGMTEEQVEALAKQARLETYGGEDPGPEPEPDPAWEFEQWVRERMKQHLATIEAHVKTVVDITGESREAVEGIFSALGAYAERIWRLVLTLSEINSKVQERGQAP